MAFSKVMVYCLKKKGASMCGIVSLVYKDENADLGQEATALLKRLEYRGYDSTGASFINDKKQISLFKKVGGPSKVCPALGIDKQSGQRFIGQVRWATYGAVTDINSQPHHVQCKVEMVGAHNGNISNTDSLKNWLTSHGHAVISDNDGEIIVHLVEEYYAQNATLSSAEIIAMRQAYAASGFHEGVPDGVLRMVDAIRKADALAEGSYAAAVADPQLPGVFAMKSGSSLYAGVGSDSHGDFIVVSSDLTSVLSKTRALIPLAEGEGLWFTEDAYLVFALHGPMTFSKPRLKRSKLSVKDTQLDPHYKFYMEQEILSSPANMDQILRYYFRDPKDEALSAVFEDRKDECKECADELGHLSEKFGDDALKADLEKVFASPSWADVRSHVSAAGRLPDKNAPFVSDEAELLADLAKLAPDRAVELRLMDQIFVWRKRRAVLRYVAELKSTLLETNNSGGRIYFVAAGTSYHAALTAAYFFNGIAHIPIYPCNPGMFRSMYISCLRSDDFILGITQSGETKDLVDIFQDVKELVPGIRRACLVNNENSRIPQELSDFYLPLLCGPETAVAATKSFINQVAILYVLATSMVMAEKDVKEKIGQAKKLMQDTIATATDSIEVVAERLYQRPSIHILGTDLLGIAKEGALKIREVVLNHTEGYDAAEFKHGPNTILGKNTVYSLSDMEKLLAEFMALQAASAVSGASAAATITGASAVSGASGAAAALTLGPNVPADKIEAESGRLAHEVLKSRPELIGNLYRGYPLVFVCPPDERDARITVSQIHTHKIRGADIILIAERRQDLALAVEGRPMNDATYWSKYIEIPHTGDPYIFVFGAAIALQYLAFRMSVRKMEWLDELGIVDHGVHPDVPKNVSKSITVD